MTRWARHSLPFVAVASLIPSMAACAGHSSSSIPTTPTNQVVEMHRTLDMGYESNLVFKWGQPSQDSALGSLWAFVFPTEPVDPQAFVERLTINVFEGPSACPSDFQASLISPE